jgi:ankyrin repeat protein
MKPIQQARQAIREGDVDQLAILVKENPGVVKESTEDNPCFLLHTVANYPGNRPQSLEMAKLLIDAGAEVNARFLNPKANGHSETALHWAASNDDVDLAELLLDRGADIESDGGCVANGTPVWLSVVFKCVNAARLLIERGAVSNLMVAAGAGRLDLIDRYFDEAGKVVEDAGALSCWDEPRSKEVALNSAFGLACRNGHVTIAKRLLSRGADPTWLNPVGETAFQQAEQGRQKIVVDWMKERGIVA